MWYWSRPWLSKYSFGIYSQHFENEQQEWVDLACSPSFIRVRCVFLSDLFELKIAQGNLITSQTNRRRLSLTHIRARSKQLASPILLSWFDYFSKRHVVKGNNIHPSAGERHSQLRTTGKWEHCRVRKSSTEQQTENIECNNRKPAYIYIPKWIACRRIKQHHQNAWIISLLRARTFFSLSLIVVYCAWFCDWKEGRRCIRLGQNGSNNIKTRFDVFLHLTDVCCCLCFDDEDDEDAARAIYACLCCTAGIINLMCSIAVA